MKKLFMFFIAIAISSLSFAQLTGTKTIPGDYATITAAIADLNVQGVGSGGVTFNIAAGYTETITVPLSVTATGTLANPIIFKRDGVGANPLITAYTTGTGTPALAVQDGIWNLIGSDYVTINGIDLYDPNTTNPATMEYGYGMFKASATDGCQYNTILNCTVTLNRVNNATGTAPAFDGSRAIVVANALASTHTTAVTPTSAAGTNSYNRFYRNTLQNCNIGISMNGYAALSPFTLGDTGNDIGGNSIDNGNTIINFGGGASATNAAVGIRVQYQWGINISYNTINNNNGSGVNHVSNLYGIWAQAATSANATINLNTITINGGGTTASIFGISNAIGSTAASNTININDNIIRFSYTTATTGIFTAITNSASAANVNINNNNIQQLASTNYPSTGTIPVIVGGSPGGALNINNNVISNFVMTGASGTLRGITASTPTGLYTVTGNTIENLSYTTSTSTGSITGIYNFASATLENFNNNIIRNFSTPTTGTLNGIQNNTTAGTFQCKNNQIYNFTTTVGGAGGFTANGISWSNASVEISGNVIYSINSTGTSGGTGGTIYGIYVSNSSNVFKNKIYNLSSASTNPIVYGINIGGGTTNNIYNNFISDLRTPAANAGIPLAGIYAAGGTTNNIFYNTVYLDGTSSGALFGSAALYASTTPTVDMRNNILVNTCTPKGAGYTAAYRRSGTTLTTYSNNSNANCFYAGTPGANNLIMYDGGLTPYSTMSAYQTAVGVRDGASFSILPKFINNASTPYDLHIDPSTASLCESGGVAITTPIAITEDFDGNTRTSTPDVGADEFTGIAAGVINPGSFTASVISSQQINLGFTLNPASNNVVIVWNATGTFTVPTGAPAAVGAAFAGGTVLYNGTTSPVLHTGLTPATAYYYKAFSYDGTNYSTGVAVNATPTVAPPTTFTATVYNSSQINLAYTLNALSNNVVIATAATSTFGTPVNGTAYTAGGTITGGGTVIYVGPLAAFSHTGLTAGTAYYYKVWSVDAFNYFSATGATTNATPTVVPPTALTATVISSSQINLAYTLNALGNNVIIATNSTSTFGTPVNGTPYSVTGTITGGGTVIYIGPLNAFDHTSLTSGTTYYYKVWSVDASDNYSSTGITANATTTCSAYSTPYGIITFEGTTFPINCWSKYTGILAAPSTLTSTTNGWIQDDFRNVTSPVNKAARLNIYSTGFNYWLLTPQINLGAGSATLKLEFDLSLNAYAASTAPAASPDDKFAVVISTDGGTTWTSANTLREWNNTGSSYVYNNINYTTGEHVTIPLAGYSGTVMIGFYGESTVSNGDNDLMIDNVVIQEPPSCIAPTALTVTGVNSSNAIIGWTGATTVQIDYGTVGHAAGAGTIVPGVTGNPYTLSSLIASTSYDVYVRQDCGTGYSNWTGPINFTTACNGISSFPWNEGFESITIPAFPNCWSKENGDWLTTNNASTTYDADAKTGTQFLREAWSATNEFMWTPGFDLTAGTSYDFSFWWAGDTYSGWTGDIFYNTSQLSTGATQLGASFVSDANVTTKTYVQAVRTFVAPTTGTYYFAIRVNCPTSTQWYMSFDDFKMETTPLCPSPNTLTATVSGHQAILGWTQPGVATSWDIEWGTSGFTQGTGTTISTSSNPYTISGLTPVTGYSYYVRANCGSGSYSTWSGPYAFTTTVACPVPTAQTATGITTTSAVLGWTNPGGANWNIEYGITGYTHLGTGATTIASGSNPYTLNGLLAATTYQYYVQSNCGGVDGVSTWAGPFTFTTNCNIYTTPYGIITFEGTTFPINCWSKYTGLLAAPSTLTSTTSGWIQDDYRNVTSPVNKAAKINIYGTSRYYWLMTPQINLGAGSATLRLEFDLALNAWNASTAPTAGPDDKFTVVISTDGGTTWTSANTLREWNNTGSSYVYDNINSTTGEHITIPLAGYTGVVMIGFYGESTVSNGDNDLMIDNVVIQEPPACPDPSSLTATGITTTSANLGWSANGTNAWEIQWGVSGFVLGTGTIVNPVVANPYTLNGLLPSTTYSYYVKANCGATLSNWVGPISFTTSCNVSSLPFSESFAGATIPNCWKQTTTLSSNSWSHVLTNLAGGTANEMKATYLDGTGTSRLITPEINTTGVNTVSLSFRQMYDDYNAYINDVNIELQSRFDGGTWNTVWSYAGGLGNSIAAEIKTLDIPVTGNTMELAWTIDGNQFDINYWYVDDVNIKVKLAHDVSVNSIDGNQVFNPGIINPQATIQNNGYNTETFDVTMTIGAYTSTKVITALAPNATIQVSFDPWTAALGDYTATVTTALVGDLLASNNTKSKALKVMELNKLVYAYNASATVKGPISFNLSTPETLTLISDQTAENSVFGGTWANGEWYATATNTAIPYNLVKINTGTGARTVIGDMGVNMTGLSYNVANSTMYGVSYNSTSTMSEIYTIDLATGATTLVGSTSAGVLLINLAINNDGICYATDITGDQLGTVDLGTGAFTAIGPIGFNANYAQDMEFDRQTGELYMAAYGTAGQLRWVDKVTGNTLLIGNFQGDAEITGFAIPYKRKLNMKVVLGGLYSPTDVTYMRAALGSDGLPLFANNIADNIVIELHNAAAPWDIVGTPMQTVLYTDGNCSVYLDDSYTSNYYIVVKHKNSLETWSSLPTSLASQSNFYDFTLLNATYLNNVQQLNTNLYGIYGGDADGSGYIDGDDYNGVGNIIYAPLLFDPIVDVDGSGYIDGDDYSIVGNSLYKGAKSPINQ